MGTTRRHLALTGAIAAVLVVALAVAGFRLGTGALEDPPAMQAVFARVGQGLDTFSDVRVRGVPVGRVTDIALDDQGRSVVTFELDQPVAVPADTVAAIEASSIFGPTYVSLDLADGDGPFLADGDRIRRTREPTELQAMLGRVDELLGAVDPQELGALVASGARIARDLAPRTGPILDAAETLTGVAARHTEDGTRLLTDLRRLTDEMAGRTDQVVAIGRDLHRLVPVVVEMEPQAVEALDAAIRAAHTVSDVLERHPDGFSVLGQGLLPALVPPLAAVAGNLAVVPTFIDVVAVFFGELASVMHVDGPSGQTLGAIELYVPPSLCELADALACYGGAP